MQTLKVTKILSLMFKPGCNTNKQDWRLLTDDKNSFKLSKTFGSSLTMARLDLLEETRGNDLSLSTDSQQKSGATYYVKQDIGLFQNRVSI